ncbi:TonB-dependent siderophore receptor [Phenylobacterium sp.]|uniref:TonB-dependent receptor n=1 Tax=Phenylobacterium sp. TaxID=1871053 RepID=UPI0025D677CE|nr:TonB-dependent siderophore receptor [Phenylobacterium sp.]MBX3484712.1 TonB-dependent siderophore receptor [Phenylobacterium sp.]
MRLTSSTGVRSVARGAFNAAAVAGLAGMGLVPAHALAAEADGAGAAPATEVSGVDVEAAKKDAQSPKITAPLRDTPKSISVIPQELIQSTGSTSLVEALRTVPGITFGAGEGGNPVGDRPFLRGYDAQSSTFVDGLRDIGAQSREVFNTESVEVIKGASGAYAGRGGAGGGIYINNKVPNRTDSIAASVGVGTADYKRATLDVNHVIAEGVAVRLNAMVHDAGVAGRDAVNNQRWGVAPSIAFGLGGPTRATISYYHLQSDDVPDTGIPYNNPTFNARTDGRPRILTAGDGRPVKVDRSNWYGVKDRDFRKENVDMATVRLEHDFSGNLHFRNTTRYSESKQDYLWTQPDDSQGNLYYGLVWRRHNSRVSTVESIINQTDLYGTFETGGITHNFATGIEISREESENDSYILSYNGALSATFNRCSAAAIAVYSCTDLYNPNPNDPFLGVISRSNNPTNARTDTKSIYAFDTIIINEQWQVNLGARYDRYDAKFVSARATTTPFARSTFERTDNLFNYQGAVVYKPVAAAALYVSFATSATPAGNALSQGSDPSALSSAINANLNPERNKTLEAGAKWDVFGGKLSLTSAVFEINTTNVRITQADGTVATAGKRRVRGFEVGASGSITDKWDVFGGYTYLDAVLVRNGGAGAAAGLTDGQPFPNTPRNSLSLWTTYEVMPRLTVGGGANYMAKVKGSTNPNLQKFVPSYWRFDATASYVINDKLTAQLNIQNLTDKTYFTQAYPTHYATIAPGRSAVVTLNAKF